jgi:hypothetical protein
MSEMNEREAFENWWPNLLKAAGDNSWLGIAWSAWQARAALSASPAPIETHPCPGMNCGSTDGSHSIECEAETAATYAGGVFVKAAPSGEVEAVEVVAYMRSYTEYPDHPGSPLDKDGYQVTSFHQNHKAPNIENYTQLMTVAQHQRIVAAKDAEIARTQQWHKETTDAGAECMRERDELRAQLAAQQAVFPVPRPWDNPAQSNAYAAGFRAAKELQSATAQQAAVPVGFALVPERMHLDKSVIELINVHCGDDEDGSFGGYADGVLWIGNIEDDEGSKTHGLHISSADYPEEGSCTLVEFDSAPAAPQPANVETHHDVAHRAMWHTNCPNSRFGGPMKPTATGWECVSCAAKWADGGWRRTEFTWPDCVEEANALLADRSAQADAARDVLAERQRQISVEGWTPEHDDAHSGGELADAAACYALWGGGINPGNWREFWPWAPEWLKHSEPRRMLVKAGALILAEIERIDRSAQGGE